MKGWKSAWIAVAIVAGLAIGTLLVRRAQRLRLLEEARNVPVEGAVIESNAEANRRLPIADAVITASDGSKSATATSDASGYFHLVLQKGVLSDKPAEVTIRHPGYQTWRITVPTGRFATRQRLYVAALKPLKPMASVKADVHAPRPADTIVANIRVRYTINARSEINVGTAVRTFQVKNQGNVPCDGRSLCSPDGRWKAASASISLDAGADNAFNNIRVSCIAGPCPFTRIDTRGLTRGAPKLVVSATSWSDTATFLVEAEVYHIAIGAEVRELYPVIYGQAFNFTVPPSEEGVSLEADLNAAPMVFPLGPDLSLSWAACTVRNGKEEEQTMAYRCELKPGYRFK